MSKDISGKQHIKECNDLNLHKLLAFASLPVSPALDINEKQDPFEASLVPLITQSYAPQSSQLKAPSSISATSNNQAREHGNRTSKSGTSHEASSALKASASTSYQDPAGSSRSSQMIASKDVYKMAPTPVFMTPSTSVYPQVALIPETDLLRSMIVQDVKQVTQKLFDKKSKKKRGRRREKEEIIPGDFGTLKINFTKFVDVKHPPFSLDDPPAPKRTVYQRIAPYPVITTDSNKAPEMPSRKTKGTSTRSVKRQDSIQTDAGGSQESARDSTASSSSRFKRNSTGTRRSRQRDVRRSSDVPVSSISGLNGVGNDATGTLAPELASFETFPSDRMPVSAAISSAPQITNLSNIYSTATVNCISTIVGSSSMEKRPEFTGTGVIKQSDLSLAKDTNLLDTNSNCIESSPSFLLANNDASYSELLDSSTAVDSSGPNLGSPGVIGSELSSLLSELYNDFPPLTPASAEENMEVAVTNESPRQTTATVSVLSQPLTSHQSDKSVAERSSSFAEEKDSVSDTINPVYSSPMKTSAPSSFILDTITSMEQGFVSTATTSTHTISCTTEVINDSGWDNGSQQPHVVNSSNHNSEDTCHKDAQPTNDNLSMMDVDTHQSEGPKELLEIVDISPEYAATEGGGKIILIGSWNNKNLRYSCKFGEVCTPGDLIQNGVLRCFCPPHSPGKVRVCVLVDDVIISKSVEFEYVDTEDLGDDGPEGGHDWLKIKDEDLKSLLLERIEAMIDIFDVGNTLPRFQEMVCNSIDIEDTLVNVCESLSKMQDHLPGNIDYKSEKVMSLLHLSAALGFTKLIQSLCNWVETNANVIIQQEADPCKYDQFQLTPLMWACAKGKFDSVCVLIQWDESSINLVDACGCTPLSLSRDQGHTILVRYLEKSQLKGSNR